MRKEDEPYTIKSLGGIIINLPIDFARACHNRRLDDALRRSFQEEAKTILDSSGIEVGYEGFSAYNFASGITHQGFTCLIVGCSLPRKAFSLFLKQDFLQKLQADYTHFLDYKNRRNLNDNERDALFRLFDDWFDTMNYLLQR